ncbi:MAG: hypothetical protein S4CHLAM45_11590 [Chlamydiales bacterium]|nr:hypothetical protein [Chlamydiales bacterium]MCH9619651.1 hypothetical protein [Chlamydiales bacterium]MCH9623257.1 hypothetical protein [Chlamydiales bacterium]
MESWVGQYRSEVKEWDVRELLFSASTYQIEVFHKKTQESFWPFLQFEKNTLKDAFCSCDYEGRCPHLAVAYLRIFGEKKEPLHIRFTHSLWNHLFRLYADNFGFDTLLLEGEKGGMALSIRPKSEHAEEQLLQLTRAHPKESPENSIKFSDLPAHEIARWKEGRPSPELRYTLSSWSDLARWFFLLEEESPYKMVFKEDKSGFPTQFTIKWESIELECSFQVEELLKIIPALRSIRSPLTVSEESMEGIEKVEFDVKKRCFSIQHTKSQREKGERIKLDGWQYVSGVGFFSQKKGSFFDRKTIPFEDVPQALNEHRPLLEKHLLVDEEEHPLCYHMFFDKEWNWHFEAYLFERGDLQVLFDGWAYLGERGFFPVTGALFESAKGEVKPPDVSNFVNHHKIWLNSSLQFQTHLASIESHLLYRIDQKLSFYSKMSEGASSKDFGEWVYYKGQGFFSKSHAKFGQIIRPGLEIPLQKISSFIKVNSEELETITSFFSPIPHLSSRGVEIVVEEEKQIRITPQYVSHLENVQFFGDFSFVEGEGFYKLPKGMCLPEGYQEEVIVKEEEIHSFLSHDFIMLQKFALTLDPRLKIPHKMDLKLSYLVRHPKGGLKAKFTLVTEFGEIALTTILEAMEKKRELLFSEGGLLDLKDDRFAWIHNLQGSLTPDLKTIEMTTLDFIRLDATVGMLNETDKNPQSVITNRLLKELREFTVVEQPILKGLKSELRLYQQTGLQWLWFLYKNGLSALLCDDMGLGKTHQAMALMAAIINRKEGCRFLVVCPTSVIYHWQDKLETFLPKIKVHTFHGVKRTLGKLPKEGLVLTTYGVLRMEKEKLKKIPFELAIFDEIQVAKNSQSQVHKSLTSVNATMRLGLTGTPIENNLFELKSLFDTVLPGYMPSTARFRSQFVIPIENEGNEERKGELTQIIKPFILRRRKSEVLQELPEKCEDKAFCDLSETQIKLYKASITQERDDLITELRDRETPIPYIHIFSILSRLKQICNHPALSEKDPFNYQNYDSGKWDLFVELLSEARESDQKVVVFSQYLQMLDIMEDYLKKQGWGYAQIRGQTVDRRGELKRFAEDPNCVVFIGSLQAAGLGIDLTSASIVILYDRWWNAARENQAIDRVHRLGQKWKVHVFKLISKGTIEEKIDLMISKKGKLMEEIVTSDDQSVLKKFSRSELIDLLSYSE